LLDDLFARLWILGEQPHSYMSQSEIDERVRILNQALAQRVYTYEDHSKLMRQEEESSDAAQARQHFAGAQVEDLTRELSQGGLHIPMQFAI
jgi:hypothetical protein